jgi:hypothetical protein
MAKSSTKKTLVIGASTNPSRFSNICLNTLVDNNIPALAIGLRTGEVAGIKIDTGKPQYEDVHTITLYLSPVNQKEYYNYIIDLNPSRIIFNPGTWNPELVKLCKNEGIEVVNNCTLMMISGDYY